MDGSDVRHAIGLEPADAVRFLRGKGAAVTGNWTEWLDGEHARAFTVANVAKLDVVSDIHASLLEALQQGKTLQQWRNDLVPTLQAKGWWRREGSLQQLQAAGRVDANTGELAKGLTPARLSTIYRTNMQSAYMAGRYQAMVEQAGNRPFWQYVAVLDSKTRPGHRALHGRVFRFDDQGWRAFWPPCGYGCRCRVRAFNQRELDRKGLQVESTAGQLRDVQVPLRDGSTAMVTRYKAPGMPKPGFFQPDPGFNHNPGQSTWMPRLGDRPSPFSEAFVRQVVDGPAFERFVQARGELDGLFPVGVQADAARKDLGVYLASEQLAAGMARSVPMERMRLLPDLVAVGQRADDGVVTLREADGLLQGRIIEVDGLLQVVGLFWMPRAAP